MWPFQANFSSCPLEDVGLLRISLWKVGVYFFADNRSFSRAGTQWANFDLILSVKNPVLTSVRLIIKKGNDVLRRGPKVSNSIWRGKENHLHLYVIKICCSFSRRQVQWLHGGYPGDPLSAFSNLCSSQSIAGASPPCPCCFKDTGDIDMGKRVPRQTHLCCYVSAYEGLQGLNWLFPTCSFGGGVGFSVLFPLLALSGSRVSPVMSMTLHHIVSLLPDLHASHGYCRQHRAGRFSKIARYLPRTKSSSFPCASEVDLAPVWSEYWMCTCPFSIGWVLWSCGSLNKHFSLTCNLSRLFVTAAQDPSEPQAATNPSFDWQADAGKLFCEMSWIIPVPPCNSKWTAGKEKEHCCSGRENYSPTCLHPKPSCFPTQCSQKWHNLCKTSIEELEAADAGTSVQLYCVRRDASADTHSSSPSIGEIHQILSFFFI